MIAAKRAISEGEKVAKARDNSATTGGSLAGATKTPGGVAGDKGRGSEGEEFKKEKGSSSEGGEGGGGEEREGEEEEWEQVGPKNKSTITRQVCVCTCVCILDSYAFFKVTCTHVNL